MTNNRDEVSDHLTFSQRQGYEPLPELMKLEELSLDLRREIWNAVKEILFNKKYYSGKGSYINLTYYLQRVLGRFLKKANG